MSLTSSRSPGHFEDLPQQSDQLRNGAKSQLDSPGVPPVVWATPGRSAGMEDKESQRSSWSQNRNEESLKLNSQEATRGPTVRSSEGSGLSDEPVVRRYSFLPFAKTKTTHPPRSYNTFSKWLIENNNFIIITTLLTIYALTADDIRLITSERSADMVFNGFVILCMVVFGVEIVCSALGRDDYFPGFFFCLDVISTGTLVLDLSWVSDLINEQSTGTSPSNARTARAARLGAKMGRLVRVLKLYKAVLEARAARKRHIRKTHSPGDDDDYWADMDIGRDEAEQQAESRVGKKLSAITTRRVIILVLIMLLVIPILETEASEVEQSPVSAAYGANIVWEKFQKRWMSADDDAEYATELLRYVFYHNWFARRGFCPDNWSCAGDWLAQCFWIGVEGGNLEGVRAMAANATLSLDVVQAWTDEYTDSTQEWVYNFGSMPEWAQTELGSSWTQECESTNNNWMLGVSLLRYDESYAVNCPGDLRPQEVTVYYPLDVTGTEYSNEYLVFYFDKRPFVKQEAGYNLGITGFVCVVLCVSSLMFANDANVIVLNPVEKMIKRVEAIRDDPLIALKMSDEEFRAEEVAKERRKKRTIGRTQKFLENLIACQFSISRKQEEPMETVILEKTIIKLGSLLALGFGEAGANIIAHNMSGGDTAGVNVMVTGTHVDCIVGVVRVGHFSVATEVLQAKIMTFVNRIAEIVHGVINEYHGAANKNNGDTFLIIWRIDQHDFFSRIAEMSIVAFSKILGVVHKSKVLAAYRTHPGLQQRLGKNCRVHLSFGVHCGWAIEGAVGSEFKIQCSYLSPNVSIAQSIENATRIYNVPFLAAESVTKRCSSGLRRRCRLIDRVLIVGSTKAMDLYSVDLDFMSVQVDHSVRPKLTWNLRQRYKARQFLEKEKANKMSPLVSMTNLFDSDPDIAVMRRRYTVDFIETYKMGFQNYAQGEWETAKGMLQKALVLVENDGPCLEVLRFMKEEPPQEFQAPERWDGIRTLDC